MPHRKQESSPSRGLSAKGGPASTSTYSRRHATTPSDSARSAGKAKLAMFAVGPGALGAERFSRLPRPTPVRRIAESAQRGLIDMEDASSSGRPDSRAQSTVSYAMSLAGASMMIVNSPSAVAKAPHWEQLTIEMLVREESDRRVIDRLEEAERARIVAVDCICCDEIAARGYWISEAEREVTVLRLLAAELSSRVRLEVEQVRHRPLLVAYRALLTLQRSEALSRADLQRSRRQHYAQLLELDETAHRRALQWSGLAPDVYTRAIVDGEVVHRAALATAAAVISSELAARMRVTGPPPPQKSFAPQRPAVEPGSPLSPKHRSAASRKPTTTTTIARPPLAVPEPAKMSSAEGRCQQCGCRTSAIRTEDVGVQTETRADAVTQRQSPARVSKPSRPRKAVDASPRDVEGRQELRPATGAARPPTNPRRVLDTEESEARMAQLYHSVIRKLGNRPAGAELVDLFPSLRQLQLRDLSTRYREQGATDVQSHKARPSSAKSRASSRASPKRATRPPLAPVPAPLPSFQYEL